MPFVTISEARAAGDAGRLQMTAAAILKEESSILSKSSAQYDIFLSHSFKDAAVVLGVKRILEAEGKLRVFVDWVEFPALDRSKVTAESASIIRGAMDNSKSLIFATSETSPSSKWMPWELGFFDGKKGSDRVAIFPLVDQEDQPFQGQEYLSLYPQVERRDLVRKSGGQVTQKCHANFRSCRNRVWRRTR